MRYNNFTITDKLGDFSTYQGGLFTPEHEKHNLTITIKNNKTGEKNTLHTTYQFAPKYTRFKNGDGILAIALDALAYSSTGDFDSFCREFGYEGELLNGARMAFNSCKKSYDFFMNAGLQEEDLSAIQERLDN